MLESLWYVMELLHTGSSRDYKGSRAVYVDVSWLLGSDTVQIVPNRRSYGYEVTFLDRNDSSYYSVVDIGTINASISNC